MPNPMRLLLVLVAAGSLAGCYVNLGVPTEKLSVRISADKAPRTGYADCTGFFGVFATGDCSVDAAMRNGHIRKVHDVDAQAKTLLFGAYSQYTLVIHGE